MFMILDYSDLNASSALCVCSCADCCPSADVFADLPPHAASATEAIRIRIDLVFMNVYSLCLFFVRHTG